MSNPTKSLAEEIIIRNLPLLIEIYKELDEILPETAENLQCIIEDLKNAC